MSYTITIVEDDDDQRRNYAGAMGAKGFAVEDFPCRESALAGLRRRQPDLVVLDIILGSEVDGGFRLCRELLALYPRLPILFLTERIDEIDRISGLRMGAWDYQPKPISLQYLAEKVASLLRLVEFRESDAATRRRTLGALTLNEEAMLAEWNGEPVDLTLTEFRLLSRLVRNPGQAVSYDSLMHATVQQCVTNNTINTHMRNLRRKLRTLDPAFDAIRNEYGFGYRWLD